MKKLMIKGSYFALIVATLAACKKDNVNPSSTHSTDIQTNYSLKSNSTKYYSDGEVLIFNTAEDYENSISNLDGRSSQLFLKSIVNMNYTSYKERLIIEGDNAEDLIGDDFFNTMLNKDRIIQIGEYLYKINMQKELVFVLPTIKRTEYNDLVSENTSNENIRIFSTNEDVIELSESKNEGKKKPLFCRESYCPSKYESTCGNSVYIGNLSSLVFDCRIRYYAAGVFFNLKAWANTFTHGLQSTLEADQLTYFSGSVNTTLKIEASRIYKERCQSETGWYSWTVTGNGANNGITAQSYQGSKGLKKAWLKASFFYWNGKDWIKIPPSSDWYPPYHRGIKSGY